MENGEDAGSGSAAGVLAPLEARPGVLLVGAPNVGKRTLLSRLLSNDIPDTSDLSSGILCQGWTIETKYYTADLSIWITHLHEGLLLGSLPIVKQLDALVMVFDMSDESSFSALQDWVAKTDIKNFEIVLCIGNKADLLTGHYAHTEYRRRMRKQGESSSDPHPEFLDYGIDETEGCSLLGHEEPSLEARTSCLEWCAQHNIEYIEACASNSDFDKCLSVDGDMQGVDRLCGALSAHMWPGMILKSGNKITTPSLADKEDFSDEDSDYEIEYEVLSHGSDEPWERTGDAGPSKMINGAADEMNQEHEMLDTVGSEVLTSTADFAANFPPVGSIDLPEETCIEKDSNIVNRVVENQDEDDGETAAIRRPLSDIEADDPLGRNLADNSELDEDVYDNLDDLESLMYKIHNMRGNLRLMPDFQRREMAAKLAMKMATMFGESDDED